MRKDYSVWKNSSCCCVPLRITSTVEYGIRYRQICKFSGLEGAQNFNHGYLFLPWLLYGNKWPAARSNSFYPTEKKPRYTLSWRAAGPIPSALLTDKKLQFYLLLH